MYKRVPNFFISKSAYRLLVKEGMWGINDLSSEVSQKIHPFLNRSDTLGVFASGTLPPTADANGRIAGIDWIRLKSDTNDEDILKFYAYAVGPEMPEGYPVYGPFKSGHLGPISKHYGKLENIAKYY